MECLSSYNNKTINFYTSINIMMTFFIGIDFYFRFIKIGKLCKLPLFSSTATETDRLCVKDNY